VNRRSRISTCEQVPPFPLGRFENYSIIQLTIRPDLALPFSLQFAAKPGLQISFVERISRRCCSKRHLPDYCVLGAKSLLNKAHAQTHRLYGGVPARELSVLSPDCGYFNRRKGFVI
jgi:hypothetical protein